MNLENTLWIEKYRPDKLDNLIGNIQLKNKLAQYINEQDIPHLLLTGKAGTGKTSVAKILIKHIECDSLFINASDENDVETVRTKIKGFAATKSFSESGLKIIVLDESDFLSGSSLAALRNLMETFSNTTRFILTANYVERIIEPIISRTQHFQVVPPSKKEVALHLINILKLENVEYENKDLKILIDAHFPDIRKILGETQLHINSNKLEINTEELIQSDIKLKIINVLSSSKTTKEKFFEIRQLFVDNEIRDFTDIYSLLYEKVLDYGKNNISGCILAIADGSFKDSQVIDKEITAAATILNILEAIK